MQLRQYSLVLLMTPLVVALTGRSGLAFSFNLPSQQPDSPCKISSVYCTPASYSFQDFGTVTTNLKPVSKLPLGGTNDFFNMLTSSIWAENGWTFKKAQRSQDPQQDQTIKGSFDIKIYRAIAEPNAPAVGADMQLLYNPVIGKDPTGSNVHWIQRVVNNHAVINTLSGSIDRGYRTIENKIDVYQEQTIPFFTAPQNPQITVPNPYFNPFFDTFGQANQISFGDFPTRRDVQDNNNWYAELYLVQETSPKTVTIYNGISWGWNNVFTPAPPCNGGSGGGGCSTAAANKYSRPSSVPEPTAALGLLALGTWGAFQGLKLRKSKQQ